MFLQFKTKSCHTNRPVRFRPTFELLESRLLLTTFFVSNSGDDANLGTFAAPYATIQQAMDAAQPGDTVSIRGGTYRETIAPVRSGTAALPIAVESYHNEPVFVTASDKVSGTWTEAVPGSGIYSATVDGMLPTPFWSQPSSAFSESNESLSVKVANNSFFQTEVLSSANSSTSWDFFSAPYTWKVRGLSIQNIGTTPFSPHETYAYFSIRPGSEGAYQGEDAVVVQLRGDGNVALQLKRNTVNSWGNPVGSITNSTITGYDLMLGPGTAGNIQYSLIAYSTSHPAGQQVANGQWAMLSSDWSDGGTGNSSQLEILVQESNTSSINPDQIFELKVGSYEIASSTGTVLLDNFSNGDLTYVDSYPSGRNTSISSSIDQIFVDGVMQQEASYPNQISTDLLSQTTANITVHSNYQVTGFAAQPDDFYTGARFRGRVGQGWAWQTATVSSSSGNTIQLDPTSVSTWWWPNQDNHTSDAGIGYLYGKKEFLDADREWYLHQNTTGPDTLFLRMTDGADPSTHTVEHKVRNWTIDIRGNDYITIRGLNLVGGAIQLHGTGLILEDSDARYMSHYLSFAAGYSYDGGRTEGGGILLSGTNSIVRNNTIHDTAGSGIIVSGAGNLVTRNEIYNTDYSGTYAAALVMLGNDNTATFNSVHDSGRDVIRAFGQANTLMYNDVSSSNRLAHDGGLIYSYGNNGADANGNPSRIANNWVHDADPTHSLSQGIYLDNYSSNYTVDHNVLWNINSGLDQRAIYLNSPAKGLQVYHNTLIGSLSFNVTTFAPFPSGNPDPTYWTSNGLELVAQNNLILPVGANPSNYFVDYANQDFRLKSGSAAIDPQMISGLTAWTTTNGTNNVPSNFDLYLGSNPSAALPFTYHEVTGTGIAIQGINDGFIGTPDSGAYETGVPTWRAGVNGFAIQGDYDRDLDVDGRDFLIWQRQFGANGIGYPADGNQDNSVDAADLTIWQDNYGKTAFIPLNYAALVSHAIVTTESLVTPILSIEKNVELENKNIPTAATFLSDHKAFIASPTLQSEQNRDPSRVRTLDAVFAERVQPNRPPYFSGKRVPEHRHKSLVSSLDFGLESEQGERDYSHVSAEAFASFGNDPAGISAT